MRTILVLDLVLLKPPDYTEMGVSYALKNASHCVLRKSIFFDFRNKIFSFIEFKMNTNVLTRWRWLNII